MDSGCDSRWALERLMSTVPRQPALTAASRSQNAFVQASLCSVIGRKGRHLTGTFCLTGDTMEGIIQCLVFLKAFSGPRVDIECKGKRVRERLKGERDDVLPREIEARCELQITASGASAQNFEDAKRKIDGKKKIELMEMLPSRLCFRKPTKSFYLVEGALGGPKFTVRNWKLATEQFHKWIRNITSISQKK